MAEMGVSGVASGIDWDSMITKLIENAKKPALVQVTKKENLTGKKEYFEELLISLRSFQSTLAPLKLSSTFKTKEAVIERLDRNASYKGVLTATANADAAVNAYEMEVVQIAKAQTNRSKIFNSTIGAIKGASSSYFYVNAGGQKIRVGVSSNDTLQALSDKINTALQNNEPPVAVTASVVDNKLVLKSSNTGLGTTTLSTKITPSTTSDTDKLEFLLNPDNADGGTYTIDAEKAGGTINITGSNGTVYREGRDFDIVNGSEIRWRNASNHVSPGDAYQADYYADAGEKYTINATRSANSSTDAGVLNINSDKPFDLARLTLKRGNTPYIEGTDYTVNGKDIVWLEGGKKPAAGLGYTIEYEAIAGEIFTMDAQRNDVDVTTVDMADFDDAKTVQINYNSVTYEQGRDFDVIPDPANSGKAAIRWKAYDAPPPEATPTAYDIVVQNNDGTTDTHTGAGVRSKDDTLNFSGTFDDWDSSKIQRLIYGGSYIMAGGFSTAGNTLTWSGTAIGTTTPAQPSGEYTVEYTYDTGTFSLSDDNNGTLEHLGLFSDVTEAQDAVIILNGETVTRSSNTIGAATNNELIKGMNIELRGVGQVSIDVEHDANAAVEAINAFMTSYNDILSWINTRLTEKELDEDKKATIDSDDFRWNWGILTGNSLLRSTKNSLRQLTSSTFVSSFTSRTSRESKFTPMTQEGSFTVTVDNRTLTVDVKAGDTLSDIAAMINSKTTSDGLDNPLFFSDDGQEYPAPYINASVVDGKLKIDSVAGSVAALGGSSYVLAEMQLNQEYTALSQVGLKLPSTGGGSTEASLIGQLEFDTAKFMEALEDNPDDVASMFTAFATQMQTFMDDTVKGSQKEVAGTSMIQGSVPREIDNLNNQINSINKYLADFERRLQDKEASLVAQFSAAEVTMGKLLEQSSWLESVTNQLKSYSNG